VRICVVPLISNKAYEYVFVCATPPNRSSCRPRQLPTLDTTRATCQSSYKPPGLRSQNTDLKLDIRDAQIRAHNRSIRPPARIEDPASSASDIITVHAIQHEKTHTRPKAVYLPVRPLVRTRRLGRVHLRGSHPAHLHVKFVLGCRVVDTKSVSVSPAVHTQSSYQWRKFGHVRLGPRDRTGMLKRHSPICTV
jgi:hypothetical protein